MNISFISTQNVVGALVNPMDMSINLDVPYLMAQEVLSSLLSKM